uniref:ACYPI34143 protein n=1 Tax=Acyrthosiphon pisum TaxID=7029 RepID=C4WU89_ACYPI|nr:ACYPI34143 [Acyrthosiphon pisum]
MFAVVIFVLICAHAVHPSTVISGHAITKRGSGTDNAAAGAAVAGDIIPAIDGVIVAGPLSAERGSDPEHALTNHGSDKDNSAAGAAIVEGVILATGGVIATGPLSVERGSDTDHALTNHGSDKDNAAAEVAIAEGVILATGGVIARRTTLSRARIRYGSCLNKPQIR